MQPRLNCTVPQSCHICEAAHSSMHYTLQISAPITHFFGECPPFSIHYSSFDALQRLLFFLLPCLLPHLKHLLRIFLYKYLSHTKYTPTAKRLFTVTTHYITIEQLQIFSPPAALPFLYGQ